MEKYRKEGKRKDTARRCKICKILILQGEMKK